MTLWSARNGYLGTGQVAVLVVADSEAEAREKAAVALAADVADSRVYSDKEQKHYATVRSIVAVDLPYVGDELP